MTVTELSIIHLKAPVTPEFKALCEKAQAIRDAALPGTSRSRGSAAFEQIEDPTVLLVTSQWGAPADHLAQVATETNTETTAAFMEYMHVEGEKAPASFHIEGILFDAAEDSPSLLDSPVISVSRLSIPSAKKQEFIDKFSAARDQLAKALAPNPMKSGWRIEKASEDLEELVAITGWESFEKSEKFRESGGPAGLAPDMAELVSNLDRKNYKRFM